MGGTALHAAVGKGYRSAVLLIEAGADVDLKDKVSPLPCMHEYGDGTMNVDEASHGLCCVVVCRKEGLQWTR